MARIEAERAKPSGINGFAVNLYDSFDAYEAELIAAPVFDIDDPDWACDDIYMSDRFEFSKTIFSDGWERALDNICKATLAFVKKDCEGAQKLRSVQGVGVGFVSGDLKIIWQRIK